MKRDIIACCLRLVIATIATAFLINTFGCRTVKKSTNTERKTSDSTASVKTQQASLSSDDQQISIIVIDSVELKKESGYEAVNVPMGRHVLYPNGKGNYDTMNTSRPTILFLPKKAFTKKMASTTKGNSVLTKTQENTKTDDNTSHVKTELETENKVINRTENSTWFHIKIWMYFLLLVIAVLFVKRYWPNIKLFTQTLRKRL